MKNLHNRNYLKEKRKDLRNNLTSAEATLWKSLQRKQINGRKFRRQHSIENYIVDFYCASEQLIVELDGAVHLGFAQQNYDHERNLKLEALGFTVLRFENKLVFEDLDAVLATIKNSFKN
jgi:very-short-patch-repair endonuclease